MTQQSDRIFYCGVFVACASIMALQIVQSRLFSAVTWYHLSFLVISIAMFGLTLGALTVYNGDEEKQRQTLPILLQRAAFRFGGFTLVALALQIFVPIIHTSLKTILVTLPLVAGATAYSYYYAGQLVSLCLTRSGKSVGLVYGADLLGASAGCLGALFLMQSIDAPSAIMVIAAIAMASGTCFVASESHGKKTYLITAGVVLVMGLVNSMMDKPPIYTLWSKNERIPRSSINYESWNTISRVTVHPSEPTRPVFLWGASPHLPPHVKAEYQYLMIDGGAGTPITKFDGRDWKSLGYLEYDVTNIAYFIPGLSSAAIIGVGGGRDLLSARYFGATRTVAMDVNAIQIDLLTRHPVYSAYSNLGALSDSRIIDSEARNWFSRSDEKFDVIQMSLIDTWAATGAGAFALSENSLYTVDALRIFINDLTEHGVMTVSRWQKGDAYNEIGRMLTMTIEALLERGVREPWRNIFIAHSEHLATIVIGRDTLMQAQLDAMANAASKYEYKIVISPRQEAQHPILNKIYKAKSAQDIAAAIEGLPFDLSPPTDMRPFFFNQAHVSRPFTIIERLLVGNSNVDHVDDMDGHTLATLNLYIIILFSMIMTAVVLILPFRGALKEAESGFIVAGTSYFALIGLGFMFIEISLMQIMTMFLGHPVYSLGIVLFSLILSSGIGSIVSERFKLDSRRAILTWVAAIFLYVATLSVVIDPMIKALTEQLFLVRVLISIAMIMPCGMLLGFGFPTGMRMAESVSAKMPAWFWGINGACGVVASALAIFTSIGWGLDKTLLLGGCFYGLLALPALQMLRWAAERTDSRRTA